MSMGCAGSSSANGAVIYRNYPFTSHSSGQSINGNKMQSDMIVNAPRRRGYRSRRINRESALALRMKVSAYSRALPTEDDFRFIEQRVLNDSDSRKTESTALSNTDTNNSTDTTAERSKGHAALKIGHASTSSDHRVEKFHNLPPMVTAFNFAKRLEELKQARFLREAQAAEEVRKAMTKESPRVEIVTHCPKEAFLENSFSSRDSLKSRTLHVRQNSIFRRSQSVPNEKKESLMAGDDISETSFTVVHKTVKVAWEHEKYEEKVRAERLKKELGLDDGPQIPVVRYNQDDCSLDDHISVMDSDRCSNSHAWTPRLPQINENCAPRSGNNERKEDSSENKDVIVENV
ncbi:hypothetical protein Tcan_16102 [Toxocara canis]|uniref:Uncharacterized protein n=1 Tax=Toxocara canis TaxID=6265 RepID=A0A0B2UYG5_TOXCA|nr:hypothetical protein Tcan_16102 [Toxocara canis]